jgi:dihydroorotase
MLIDIINKLLLNIGMNTQNPQSPIQRAVAAVGSQAALARAKEQGLDVTAGVSIHHLTLNDLDVGDYRTFFKLTPPLRTEADRQAVIAGLADGTIDALSSDHTPEDQEC